MVGGGKKMPKDQKCQVLSEAVHLFLEKPHYADFAEMNPTWIIFIHIVLSKVALSIMTWK